MTSGQSPHAIFRARELISRGEKEALRYQPGSRVYSPKLSQRMKKPSASRRIHRTRCQNRVKEFDGREGFRPPRRLRQRHHFQVSAWCRVLMQANEVNEHDSCERTPCGLAESEFLISFRLNSLRQC